MLKVKRIVTNMVAENCYIVSDETREAVIIDCGAYDATNEQAIASYIEEEKLHPVHQIYTHTHFDHIFGCGFIANRYEVLPECHPADAALYNNMDGQCQMFLGSANRHPMPELGRLLNEGDEVTFGSHTLQVIHTPGHTPGGICFYCAEEKVLFSGDSLFCMSIGRTDFPGGNYEQLVSSLRNKIMTLPADVKVYSGHGEPTSIGFERENNPYF